MSTPLHLATRSLCCALLLFTVYNTFAQPKITGFTPSSAPAGATVAITGSGFGSATAANIVYFGAVRANVLTATAAGLTVTVPAGATYQPISVLVTTTGLAAYSPRPFVPTFTNPFGSGISANFYKPFVNIPPTGYHYSNSSAVGDLDGDGKPDVVTAGFYDNTVAVLRNTAAAGALNTTAFAARVDFPTGNGPRSLIISDVNNDGRPDIVVANYNAGTVSVLRNMITAPGNITAASFAAKVDFAVGTNPEQVVASDLDGDGRTDLAVLEKRGSNSVYFMRNTSAANTPPSFAAPASLEGPFITPSRLAIGDLNGDGKPDLAIAGGVFSIIRLYRNNATPGSLTGASFISDGELQTGISSNTNTTSIFLEIGDIDGDQQPDLVGSCNFPYRLLLFRNNGSAGNALSFETRTEITLSNAPFAVSIGDADGDSKPDVLISNSAGISVLRNVATPGTINQLSLAPKVDFTINYGSIFTSLVDINGDGVPEVVDLNDNQYISLLQVNTPPTQTPAIGSFTPDKGPAGTTVTITGSNFNTTPAKNLVYFGAVRADVTGGSSTSLTVKVPAGATYQPLTVLDSATGLTGYSSKPFNTTFTNPFGTGIPANFYRQGVSFSAGATVTAVAISDLDGDRKPDLVTTNFYNGNTVTVLRNQSPTGTISPASFGSPVAFSSPPVNSSIRGPFDVATGDLDGDGKPEIVVTHYGTTGSIQIFRNLSTPGTINSASFAAPVTFPLGSNPPGYVAIHDLDGDGRAEIIAGTSGDSYITVLVNLSTKGNISYTSFSRIDLPIASPASAVAVRDLDGDGKPDLVAAISGGSITVFRNIGTPGTLSSNSFASRVELPAADHPVSVAVADFDGDGKQDIAYGSTTRLDIFQNTGMPGNITTASFTNVPVASTPYASLIAVDDLDGDGKPDIAGVQKSAQLPDLLVVRNLSGPGTLTSSSFTSTTLATGSYFGSLAIGDLDGDGIPELAPAGFSSGVTVLKVNVATPLLPPSVTQFSPASGPAGTVVTISGANFNAVLNNNVVYFGAVRGTVTAASTTGLTVVVPPGVTNQPVSVLNFANGLTGYASKPFITTFNNPLGPGIPGNFYKPKTDFATGALPYAVAPGDLDYDGKVDVVVANENANTISILRNRSGSTGNFLFDTKIDLSVGAGPRAVAVGDINGDGKPDIVVVNARSSTISVLSNTNASGSGSISSFASKIDFATGDNPYSVAIGDADGDGKPDLIVTNLIAGTISVLRNTGSNGTVNPPSFAAPVSFAAGTYPRFVAVGDLDGDGRMDIAVANERSSNISVLRNTATPGSLDASSFAAAANFATGSNPDCVVISDMDGDGKPDLVASNYSSNTVSVLRNTATVGAMGTGSFAVKTDFTTGNQPFSVATGDVDGDGKIDITTVNAGSNTLSVLRNLAAPGSLTTSSFAAKVDFATGNYPIGIALGDLDGDGAPELIPVNAGSNTFSVLTINVTQPPLIAYVSPGSASAGATTTIGGANFNAVPAGNIVYFGAVKAVVTGGNSGSLTVTVPAGATYQPVTVLNSANGLTGYSSSPFLTRFANPFGTGIPANFYRPKVDFSTGASAFLYAVAFGDMDGDGKPDMVGVNRIAQTVSVLRNISATGTITASSFAAPLVISTPNYPESVSLADIDGDGKLDIVTANPGSYSFSVLRNLSSPGALTAASFAARVDISTGVYISSLTNGDLDRDGKTDIVVTNLYSGSVSVFRNTAAVGVINASSFAAKIDYPAGDFPRFVAISDINNDAKPELIVANERSNNVSVLLNTATPGFIVPASFSTKFDYAAGGSPSCVAVGGLRVGGPDIVVCNYGSNSVSVLKNTSNIGTLTAGSFATRIDFSVGTRPFFVTIGDADGNGLADLITANSGSNNISVLRNAGELTDITAQSFAPKVDFSTGGYPLWVALGDLDGDGIAELATANASNATISVLKIGTPAQAVATTTITGLQTATDPALTGTLQLYPNPTSGDFTLQMQGLKGAMANVEVFDKSGKLVKRSVVNTGSKLVRLSLHNQPAGIYYVKVTALNGVQVAKVTVQR